MVAKNINPLIVQLISALDKRKMSVPRFSKETGIKQDRVYKWIRDGHNPKNDDVQIINKWLGGKLEESSNSLESQLPLGNINVTVADYINLLKQYNQDLRVKFLEVGTEVSKVAISLDEAKTGLGQLEHQLYSGRHVVLHSLSRLEKKPPGALEVEADKIVIQRKKQMKVQGTQDESGSVHKG